MKKLYLSLIAWTVLIIIFTIATANESGIKYKYATLYFSSIGIKADDKILVQFSIDYDEGTSRNISLSEKGPMDDIVHNVCRKMAEIYSGNKSPFEKWSKIKILNMLGADGWEIVPSCYKDTTDGGLSHIEGYFLKKELP